MASFWNGSGNVVRTDGTRTGSGVWAAAKAASVKILASAHDTHDQGLADSIQACIAKNGENSATANLPMGTFRHTGVGNASARNHYAAAGQIQDNSLIWGGTAGGTVNALTIALTPAITAYVTGMKIAFKTAGVNTTASPTIAVNGLAAKVIKKIDGATLLANELTGIAEVIYDGTDFILVSALSRADVSVVTSTGSSNAYVVTFSPAITAYNTGTFITMKANHSITAGAVTINVNSLGNKSIVLYERGAKQTNLLDNEIQINGIYQLVYDGTDFILLNPSDSNQFLEVRTATTGLRFAVGSIAAAGTNQATATALAVKVVNFVTGADGVKGVVLPAVSASAGDIVHVLNSSASSLKIYPPSGLAIGANAPNAAITITAFNSASFIGGDSTRWFQI
jgi:hypothetical protein